AEPHGAPCRPFSTGTLRVFEPARWRTGPGTGWGRLIPCADAHRSRAFPDAGPRPSFAGRLLSPAVVGAARPNLDGRISPRRVGSARGGGVERRGAWERPGRGSRDRGAQGSTGRG